MSAPTSAPHPVPGFVYKVLSMDDLDLLRREGAWSGSADDRRDGFVHLSTRAQLPGTLARHFAGRAGLVVAEVDPEGLPAGSLRWEPSRGGALFPHLYASLPAAALRRALPLPLDAAGVHEIPPLETT